MKSTSDRSPDRDAPDVGCLEGAGIHEEVVNFFKTSKRTGVWNRLRDLKRLRNKADYRLDHTVCKREADQSLRLAQKLLKELDHPF